MGRNKLILVERNGKFFSYEDKLSSIREVKKYYKWGMPHLDIKTFKFKVVK